MDQGGSAWAGDQTGHASVPQHGAGQIASSLWGAPLDAIARIPREHMQNTQQLERTQVELVRQALKLAPIAVLGTLLNAFVLVLVLWQSISHTSLIIWFSITCCLAVQRSLFLYKYRWASLQPRQAAQVSKRFVVGLGLSGIVWGFVGIFLFPVDSPTHQTLIVFVLCGMVAGAVEAFSSVLPAFIAFASPALVPLFIRFLTMGGAAYYAMAAMTLFYILLTLIIARRINITNRRLVELKEHFSRIAEERTASNARLQEEISERRRMEDSLRDSEKQLRLLSSRLLSTQEEERKRIARELHDSIGASLSAAKFSMENVIDQIEKGTVTLEPINYSIRVIQLAIDEVRRIFMDLRPSILDDMGIIATINWFCKQFETIYPNIHIEMKIEIEEDVIPEVLKIIIFRIIQEAFQNIGKYSGTDWVEVSISKLGDTMQLSIEDHGIGFDLSSINANRKSEKGIGLMSMRERTELSGGVFEIESKLGEGTGIQASWTLPR
jgi:signal transduction histidine kinase